MTLTYSQVQLQDKNRLPVGHQKTDAMRIDLEGSIGIVILTTIDKLTSEIATHIV